MKKPIIVLDTNTMISAVIRPFSVPNQAFEKAFMVGTVVYSSETYNELLRVIKKPKFEKYVTEDETDKFNNDFKAFSHFIENITTQIVACRDPKDDKFLTLAVAANADYIVTGDEDLLVLHPFQGIQIIKPAAFLEILF